MVILEISKKKLMARVGSEILWQIIYLSEQCAERTDSWSHVLRHTVSKKAAWMPLSAQPVERAHQGFVLAYAVYGQSIEDKAEDWEKGNEARVERG